MDVTSFDYKLEPPEYSPVSYCEVCNEPLYAGDEVYIFSDEANTHLCSEECLEYYGGVVKIILGDN